ARSRRVTTERAAEGIEDGTLGNPYDILWEVLISEAGRIAGKCLSQGNLLAIANEGTLRFLRYRHGERKRRREVRGTSLIILCASVDIPSPDMHDPSRGGAPQSYICNRTFLDMSQQATARARRQLTALSGHAVASLDVRFRG